jgi:hypothetical protein
LAQKSAAKPQKDENSDEDYDNNDFDDDAGD